MIKNVLHGHDLSQAAEAQALVLRHATAMPLCLTECLSSNLQTMAAHKVQHERFTRLVSKLLKHEPPCMSEAEDWESANGWLDTLVPPPASQSLASVQPEANGKLPQGMLLLVTAITDKEVLADWESATGWLDVCMPPPASQGKR